MVANTSLTNREHSQSDSLLDRTPPLENGDRLSRSEFERRYTAMPDLKKAELVEGVVYLASPLRFKSHAKPHSNLIAWLSNYQIVTPGVELGIEPTVRLDEDNEPQPDGVLFLDAKVGGQVTLSEDDYLEGAPELVVEVAASSAAYDLHDKKNAYRRNGVREYIVWRVFDKKLDWFVWQEGEYVSLTPDENGIFKSQIFPGLWLEVSALISGDMVRVLAVFTRLSIAISGADFVNRVFRS